MGRRIVAVVVLVLGVALSLTAVAAADRRAPTPLPSAMAALGNSLSRGWGSLGGPSDYPGESWSTGSDPAVGSHYLRLLALNPGISGNAFNDAQSGTQMAATTGQASTAVSQLSSFGASYVTIESGTNDVCTSTVAQMTSVSDFAEALRATLTTLTSGVPSVQVLVLSIPNWFHFWKRYHDNPDVAQAWVTYPGRCPDLLSTGATDADRKGVGERIEKLNHVIAQVCKDFPACQDDKDATFKLWPSLKPSELAFDSFHLTPAGQARLADNTWPPDKTWR